MESGRDERTRPARRERVAGAARAERPSSRAERPEGRAKVLWGRVVILILVLTAAFFLGRLSAEAATLSGTSDLQAPSNSVLAALSTPHSRPLEAEKGISVTPPR
jgi:hypothetical protein